MPALPEVQRESPAPRAGVCWEAPGFGAAVCFKLEFLVSVAAQTLLES